MSLVLAEMKQSGNDFGRVEEGTYPARICQVIDFGVQPQTDWQTGEPTTSKPRVMITWEFPTSRAEITNDEGTQSLPRWLSKEFTISKSDKSNLIKLVSALAPRASSLDELLNLPCMVQVGSTSGGKGKVLTVLPAMQGMEVAELENDTAFFDFSHPVQELFESLHVWQQGKIKEAEDYNGFADAWGAKEEEKSEY
jgi:hypothetical protein